MASFLVRQDLTTAQSLQNSLKKPKTLSFIQGKNVNVYLEDADFGFQAAQFVYNPNLRLVDFEDATSTREIQPSSISAAEKKDAVSSTSVNGTLKRLSGSVLQKNSVEKNTLPAQSPRPNQQDSPKVSGNGSVKPANDFKAVSEKKPQSDSIQLMSGSEWDSPIVPAVSQGQSVVETESILSDASSRQSAASENVRRSNPMPAYQMNHFDTANPELVKTEPESLTEEKVLDLIQKNGSKLAWKKGNFTLTPYGYINLSAAWESQRTVVGDYCVYAQSPELAPQSDRSAFYVDPRSSRGGLKIDGAGLPCWNGSTTRGVFEFDFQGNYTVRNRSGFLMRKAYVEVGDKCTKFLAGQDWEIVSPLYPSIFNYPAGSGCGNLGYRRAMLRMDRTVNLDCDSSFLLQSAICDNTIRDYTSGSFAGSPTVTAGGWPILQGRVAYAFGAHCFEHHTPVTIGVSAQIGEQRADYPALASLGLPAEIGQTHRTWVVCLDMDVPVTKKLKFQAELYNGENVSNLEGGILQGIDMIRRDSIRCSGGWGTVQYQWTKKVKTLVGYSFEDPYDNDLRGTGMTGGSYTSRTFSESIFANITYNWTEALLTGIEVSQWKTDWQAFNPATQTVSDLESGKPTRVEFIVRYVF